MLDPFIKAAQYAQGIGAAGKSPSAGERAVVGRLFRRHPMNAAPLCIFDVGANKGQFAALVSDQARKRPFVMHCFEPGSRAFEDLTRNCGERQNIRLNHFGLGAEPGDRELYFDSPGSELASLTRRDLSHVGLEMSTSETVRIETLDCYCLAREIPRIDLLKLDVEGHELDILHGGSRIFEQKVITAVLFEFGGCDVDTRTFVKDFFYFFIDHGMQLGRVTPTGHVRYINRYSEALEQFRTTSFLASIA